MHLAMMQMTVCATVVIHYMIVPVKYALREHTRKVVGMVIVTYALVARVLPGLHRHLHLPCALLV